MNLQNVRNPSSHQSVNNLAEMCVDCDFKRQVGHAPVYDILIYPEFCKTMALKGVENNRFAPKTWVLALLDCVLYSSCKVRHLPLIHFS